MNKLALALGAFGLFAGVACKSADSGQEMNTEITDATAPVTIALTGMT